MRSLLVRANRKPVPFTGLGLVTMHDAEGLTGRQAAWAHELRNEVVMV
jgi:hypothetical protein